MIEMEIVTRRRVKFIPLESDGTKVCWVAGRYNKSGAFYLGVSKLETGKGYGIVYYTPTEEGWVLNDGENASTNILDLKDIYLYESQVGQALNKLSELEVSAQ